MRRALAGLVFAVVLVLATAFAGGQTPKAPAGIALSDLSWIEAEAALTPSAVVVIPLGIATVQHGPHLKLNNNERLARYLGSRVQAAVSVVVAPPLTYHFSPTFPEYPGSTSLTQRTARDMTVEIVRSLARYGPRRFYVLNTGVSTLLPLRAAADALAAEGILLGFTDMTVHLASANIQRQQTPVSVAHADEIETSIMLYVDPSAVDMKKAVREYGAGFGGMTRQKDAPGVYSASGVLGDPTLATREKGQVLVETLVSRVLEDIESLRRAPLPQATGTRMPAPSSATRSPGRGGEMPQPNGCTPGDERTIRDVATRFSGLWRQMDSEAIALLFTGTGDIRHPDGSIERGQYIIRENRRGLFTRREYRGSVHPVSLTDVRCLGPNHALADGKWELRLVDSPGADTQGRRPVTPLTYAGWCTLVFTGGGGAWSIEAWRYTVNPPNGTQPPTTLKQPGFIGRQ